MFNNRPHHGGNLAWAAQVAGCSPFALLDFSASISPLGPPPSAIAAIQDGLLQLAQYPDPQYAKLRQQLAQHHHLAPDWVLPGNGAAELLTWAGRDLAALEATYLLTPAFGDYGRSLRAFAAHQQAIPLPLTAVASGKIDWLTVVTQGLMHDPARCGLLLNTPHNPTGLLMPLSVLETLLSLFRLVVVDEAFMDFVIPSEQQSLIPQIARWPNLIIVRSLTKFYSLPGLRLGYAIAQPQHLKRWQQWRDPWSVNALAAAAVTVLQDHDFQQRTWQWLGEARPALFQELAAIPGVHPLPGRANYLLVRCDRSVTALQQTLLQRDRILIRDCLSFPELGDRYFRVAVRLPEENERLVDALRRVMT
ncbi:threonine-phosphate decarboxylase [Leptolyngbya iicbica LK]|uniref:threonine-phosphate decarboxylase n=2 Tax=Cyanophyceae TaxID=3028117 RepID=A0A4Q7E6N4_9CYAN|nr:threonine-phosphate decarboxylase CobD [Leptolyngbya sp. LK]RZM78022.1 threonine-phosphate decarboxylase [Leptolyngbya sp. LK]